MKLSEYLKKVDKGDFHPKHRKSSSSRFQGLPIWNLINSIIVVIVLILVIVLMIKVYGGNIEFGSNDTIIDSPTPLEDPIATATSTATPSATPTATPTATPVATSTPDNDYPPDIRFEIDYQGVKYTQLPLDINLDNFDSSHQESLAFTAQLQNLADSSIHCEADTYKDGDKMSGCHSKWPEIDRNKAKNTVILWNRGDEEVGDLVELESRVTCYPVGEEDNSITESVYVTLNFV